MSRQSVLRWHQAWQKGGTPALKAAGRAGRKPRLSCDQNQRLAQILTAGPEAASFPTPLWTLSREARVIRRGVGVACHPTTAMRILAKRLRWSCQSRAAGETASRRLPAGRTQRGHPVGRAIERDAEAIRHWKHRDVARPEKSPP